jgi:hypothetical protein
LAQKSGREMAPPQRRGTLGGDITRAMAKRRLNHHLRGKIDATIANGP